jgi:hypothetical protein
MPMPPPRLFLLIASAAFLFSVPAHAQLRFAQTSANLTTTADAQTLTAQFPFQNTGTNPIFVAGLTTSCPCTTAQTDKKHLSPGETGTVVVTYKIGASEGPQSHTITLLTNETGGTTYTLTVKADLPASPRATLPRVVNVTPTLLFWSKKPFATKTIRVDLRGFDGAKLTATCANPIFSISINISADKHEALIAITPDASATDARAELLLSLEHPTEKIAAPPVALTLQLR